MRTSALILAFTAALAAADEEKRAIPFSSDEPLTGPFSFTGHTSDFMTPPGFKPTITAITGPDGSTVTIPGIIISPTGSWSGRPTPNPHSSMNEHHTGDFSSHSHSPGMTMSSKSKHHSGHGSWSKNGTSTRGPMGTGGMSGGSTTPAPTTSGAGGAGGSGTSSGAAGGPTTTTRPAGAAALERSVGAVVAVGAVVVGMVML